MAIVYTDVGDSTGLNQELGDPAAHELLRRHHKLVRREVARCAGVELDLMGDGFKLAFDDPRQAVECGVAIQRKLSEENAGGGPRVRVRVGIHAGAVIRDGEDLFGETPIIAQRVMSRARVDEILVSDAVRRDAQALGDVEVTDRGLYHLKGLRGAHRLFEVIWGDAGAEDAPRPAPAPDRRRTPLVGREAELHTLEELLQEAERGSARVALLTGEPGIGKTRLAAEFLGLIRARKVAVAAGRCYAELAQPYQPFLECARTLVAEVGAPDLPFAADARALAGLVPELAAGLAPDAAPGWEPAGGGGSADPLRLLNAFATLFLAWAEQQPVVLLLDDLQWADPHSVDLLRTLGRRLSPVLSRGAPFLILANAREDDAVKQPGLAAALRELDRDHLLERVAVRRLDQTEVTALLRGLGGEPAAALAPGIFPRSLGNPYFVEELYRDSRERAALGEDPAAGEAGDTAALPAGVKQVIEQRLDRLGARALQVLTLASLMEGGFSFDVLCEATGLGEADVIAALEESLAARVLRERGGTDDPHYVFEHTLVAEALSEQLSGPRARHGHLAIADALERVGSRGSGPRDGEIAHHLIQAGAAAPARRVAQHASRAGDRASGAFAFEDAARFYEAALAACERAGDAAGVDREELRSRLAAALGRTGRVDEAQALSDAAIEAFTRARRRDAADRTREAIADTLVLHARHSDAIPYLSVVARRRGRDTDGATAKALAQYAIALDLTGRGDAARRVAERVNAVANQVKSPELRYQALSLLRTWQANHTAQLDRALLLSRRLVRLAERRGDAWDLASSWSDIALFEFVQGRVGRAVRALEQALEVAPRSGTFATILDVRALRALCFAYRGEWSRVDEEWRRAEPLRGRVPGALRIGLLLWARSVTDLWLGRGAPPIQAPERLYSGSAQLQNDVVAGAGLIASERGDPAAPNILAAADERQPVDGAGVNWLLGSQAIAGGWVNLGRRDEAARWYDALAAYRGTLLVGSTDLLLARIDTLLGRTREARAHLARALRQFRREGLRPFLGMALYEKAAVEAAAGRGEHAAAPRAEAMEVFESLGMRPWLDRTRDLAERRNP